jgi:hypothetical protein
MCGVVSSPERNIYKNMQVLVLEIDDTTLLILDLSGGHQKPGVSPAVHIPRGLSSLKDDVRCYLTP